MADQLELLPVDPEERLNERQKLALASIRDSWPMPSEELGAILHEDRQARGGKGHARDSRCGWCLEEGKGMGSRLRKDGLVRFKKDEGWYPSGIRFGRDQSPRAATSGYDPKTAPIPY